MSIEERVNAAAKKQNYTGTTAYPILMPFDTIIFQRPHRMKKKNGCVVVDPAWYIQKYHPKLLNEFLESWEKKSIKIP